MLPRRQRDREGEAEGIQAVSLAGPQEGMNNRKTAPSMLPEVKAAQRKIGAAGSARRGYLGRFGFSGSLMGAPRADSTASRETTLPVLLPQEAHFFSAGLASRVNSRQSKQ